jgi:hypothetical protein
VVSKLAMMGIPIMEMDAPTLVQQRVDLLALGPSMLSHHVSQFVEMDRESGQNSAMTATLLRRLEAV